MQAVAKDTNGPMAHVSIVKFRNMRGELGRMKSSRAIALLPRMLQSSINQEQQVLMQITFHETPIEINRAVQLDKPRSIYLLAVLGNGHATLCIR